MKELKEKNEKKKKQRGRPKGSLGALSNEITPQFAEELFRLWLNGKTLHDIVHLYMGANNRRPQFSLVKLQSVYREYKWEERRKGIVKEIMEASDKQIIMDKHKQLVALSMMLEINTRKIEEVYKEYVIDPKKFFNKIEKDKKSKKGKNSGHFLCVVDSMEELKSLFDYYKKITSPEMAENGVVTPGLSFVQQNVMLPQQNNTVNNNVQIRDNKLCLDNPEIRGQFFNLIKNIADLRANGESEKEPLLLEDKDDR